MAASDQRESEIRELARALGDMGAKKRNHVFHLSWWGDRALEHSMADPVFRARLFRFVDVFPALGDDTDVEEHLRAEFKDVDVPRWFGTGLGLTKSLPGGDHISAGVARRGIDRMARLFIMGTEAHEVAEATGTLWGRGVGSTLDLLGEHTYSESEADRYAKRLARLVDVLGAAARSWPSRPQLEHDDVGPLSRTSVSVKVTALASSFTPLCEKEGIERAAHRLLPILRRASELGISVWFDTERYEEKDLTHRLFRRVLSVPGLERLHAGMVVQAYLRDAADDLEDLARWARGRDVVPSVRLVKGAYWDTETVHAASRGWPSPVFEHKAETDSNYERLARMVLEHHGTLRGAFATHNLRTLAAAMVDARRMGISEDGYEIQLLYGMAEPLHEALRHSGRRLRVYAPVGELVPGMAYLVRRLLENTSNESFVRHLFTEGEPLEQLLVSPGDGPWPPPPDAARREATAVSAVGPYRPEPPAQWHRHDVRSQFAAAVEAEFARPVRRVQAVVAGQRLRTSRTFVSVDPADPDSVVAEVAACNGEHVETAVQAALSAAPHWGQADPRERAGILFAAADVMRRRRFEIAALEVRECAKGWSDSDADVCEAIDYCEYYGRRMLEIAAGGEVQSPLGEKNELSYRPRGLCAVVSPWNFPLAIPTGMTAAALVTGNVVVLKPAEQSPAVAAELVEVFAEAGLPPGVLSFLPGSGEEVGAPLVQHPAVDVIAFTGSRDVGLGIVEAAARRREGRRSIARVVAELGGKNSIVVDSDADLDEVVPAVVSSAFGFSGQKCSAASRLVVVDKVHDAVVGRVLEATRSLVIGPPRVQGTQLGPVIDQDAHDRLRDCVMRAREVGRVVLDDLEVPPDGWYVSPSIFTDVDPGSWLATEELFGPVLATFRAKDFSEALALADSGDYALTAGVFSRSPEHIRLAARTLKSGNLYVNRAITGAVVGRQPFGGGRMSGVGAKAGGPDYLLQFLDPQVVTENTIRQGFAPEALAQQEPPHPEAGPAPDVGVA